MEKIKYLRKKVSIKKIKTWTKHMNDVQDRKVKTHNDGFFVFCFFELVSHYVTRLVLNSQAQEKPPTLAS
jgi:hypothetical protein